MASEQANRRALLLLVIGSVIGILLGVAVTLQENESDADALPSGAIALMNGRPISEEEYVRAVALFASDKRTGVTNADRVHVLNRLIEEELLIQQGVESGLVDSDRAIRKAITQAMLASVVAESASVQPSADELRAFYTANLSLFARSASTGTVQVTAGGKAEPPPFEEVRDQVEAAYLRHSRDEALREYLEWLRNEAEIVLAPEAHQ